MLAESNQPSHTLTPSLEASLPCDVVEYDDAVRKKEYAEGYRLLGIPVKVVHARWGELEGTYDPKKGGVTVVYDGKERSLILAVPVVGIARPHGFSAADPESSAPDESQSLREGTVVSHPEFGLGKTVSEMWVDAYDQLRVEVNFGAVIGKRGCRVSVLEKVDCPELMERAQGRLDSRDPREPEDLKTLEQAAAKLAAERRSFRKHVSAWDREARKGAAPTARAVEGDIHHAVETGPDDAEDLVVEPEEEALTIEDQGSLHNVTLEMSPEQLEDRSCEGRSSVSAGSEETIEEPDPLKEWYFEAPFIDLIQDDGEAVCRVTPASTPLSLGEEEEGGSPEVCWNEGQISGGSTEEPQRHLVVQTVGSLVWEESSAPRSAISHSHEIDRIETWVMRAVGERRMQFFRGDVSRAAKDPERADFVLRAVQEIAGLTEKYWRGAERRLGVEYRVRSGAADAFLFFVFTKRAESIPLGEPLSEAIRRIEESIAARKIGADSVRGCIEALCGAQTAADVRDRWWE